MLLTRTRLTSYVFTIDVPRKENVDKSTHQHTIQPRHRSNHTTTTTATYHFAPFCRRQLVRPTLHTLDGSQLEGAPRCTSRPPPPLDLPVERYGRTTLVSFVRRTAW